MSRKTPQKMFILYLHLYVLHARSVILWQH